MKDGLDKRTQLSTDQFPIAQKGRGANNKGKKSKHPYLKAGFKFKSQTPK